MTSGNGINFSGLASGLDTQAIVSQLVALERIPIDVLEVRRREEQGRLDLLANFKQLVEGLKDAAETLSTTGDFYAYTVGTSQSGVANIGATSNASPGSHTLEVLNLASTDRWAFDGVADRTAALTASGGQTVDFDVAGNSYSIAIDPAQSSLDGIAAAIQDQAGADVNVSVVNTGTASNPSFQLVLASRESGEDGLVTNVSSSVTGLTIDGTPGGSSNVTVGANAVAVIDGLTVERTDNDFSDVVPGVTIDLLGTTDPIAGEVLTFNIEADRDALRANVDGFIDAYNAVNSFINEQSTFTPSDEEGESGTVGGLFGDSILRRVRSEIQRSLFDVDIATVTNDTEGYSTLSLIGIRQANDGTLSIDDTVFDAKLTENLDALADLFVDSDGFDNGGAAPGTPEYFVDISADSGLAATLVRSIERMLEDIPSVGGGSVPGVFEAREDAIRDQIDGFDDRIEEMERRLVSFEENLVRRFARLEELMGALNAQGAALSSALAGLTPRQ